MTTKATFENIIALANVGITNLVPTPEPALPNMDSLSLVDTSGLVAVCVGHSRSGDKGAVSVGGVSEWNYNFPVAESVVTKLTDLGVPAISIINYSGDSYGDSMSWLAKRLKIDGVGLAIELHFNAASASANGYEYLYWESSYKAEELAQSLLDAHTSIIGAGKNRGLKPKGSGDRGSHFLSKTHCPAVICEPFFGSNDREWGSFAGNADELAEVYAVGISNYLKV